MATTPPPRPDHVEPQSPPETPAPGADPIEPRPDEVGPVGPDSDQPDSSPAEVPEQPGQSRFGSG